MEALCRDLLDEYQALDDLVSGLDDAAFAVKTRCADWTVKDQICHIAYFDAAAREAVTDVATFARSAGALFKDIDSFETFNQRTLTTGRQMTIPGLMNWWSGERALLVDSLRRHNPGDRIPWYGPSMSARSFATARLMETWAHGQNVADALKIKRTSGDRLKHIAHLGVTTFAWSFANRNLPVPDKPVRVELSLPSGASWSRGPDSAADLIRGSAEDFCLVVTQRRHVADTCLSVRGAVAMEWMLRAQAYAGPPDNGPPPGMFR